MGPAPTMTTSQRIHVHSIPSTLRVDVCSSAAASAAGSLPPAFGHIGPAAALAADGLRDGARELAGMHLRRQILGHRRDDRTPSNPSIVASTTMPVFHLLRSESASSREAAARSSPSTRADSTFTPLIVARLDLPARRPAPAPACVLSCSSSCSSAFSASLSFSTCSDVVFEPRTWLRACCSPACPGSVAARLRR